ncbi:hypothetical protein EH31_13590 [Erythrobacter longus]|uniref:DUF4402 domain-containing protein n=1 Tax=Erythrobacter longus TaxID=1044 RepID=A0A074MTX0_ERYLO|nr:DUF4402 domain-containing protein [Erythrobacter longus]KEO89067.1 hypothetical protein EH31_13590 [Erythrobacter longus]
MFQVIASWSLRLGTIVGAAMLAVAGVPAPSLVSAAFAQGNCPNCDLPPGCRGNGNNKDKGNNGNGNGNGRPNCQRLNITIESDIDFGRVVLLGDGESRVILDLATGEKTLIGDVDDLGGMPFTGRATITGAPFEQVMISLPSEVSMRDNQGGNAIIRDFVSDVESFAVLDSFGQLEFRFSGTLVLGADQQAAGILRGRVPISVEYP